MAERMSGSPGSSADRYRITVMPGDTDELHQSVSAEVDEKVLAELAEAALMEGDRILTNLLTFINGRDGIQLADIGKPEAIVRISRCLSAELQLSGRMTLEKLESIVDSLKQLVQACKTRETELKGQDTAGDIRKVKIVSQIAQSMLNNTELKIKAVENRAWRDKIDVLTETGQSGVEKEVDREEAREKAQIEGLIKDLKVQYERVSAKYRDLRRSNKDSEIGEYMAVSGELKDLETNIGKFYSELEAKRCGRGKAVGSVGQEIEIRSDGGIAADKKRILTDVFTQAFPRFAVQFNSSTENVRASYMEQILDCETEKGKFDQVRLDEILKQVGETYPEIRNELEREVARKVEEAEIEKIAKYNQGHGINREMVRRSLLRRYPDREDEVEAILNRVYDVQKVRGGVKRLFNSLFGKK